MKRALILSALIAAAALGTAVGANAFTIQTMGGGSGDDSKFTDPDEAAPVQRLTNPSTGQNNGYTFSSPHFGFSVTHEPSSGPYGNGSKNYFDPSQSPVRPFSGFSTGAGGNGN
jgi:hypothetical protein